MSCSTVGSSKTVTASTNRKAETISALFAFGDVWAVFALQNPDLAVRIYPDDQEAAESLCSSEIADVAGVQKVEAAVGKDDLIIVRSLFGDATDQFIA